eukprot:15364600-Ditylum_brightwellii.AAC.1
MEYVMQHASPDLQKCFVEKNINRGNSDSNGGGQQRSNASQLLPCLVQFYDPSIKHIFELQKEEIQGFLRSGYRQKEMIQFLPSPEFVDKDTKLWKKKVLQAGKVSHHRSAAPQADIYAACKRQLMPDHKRSDHIIKRVEELALLLEEAAYFAGKGKR